MAGLATILFDGTFHQIDSFVPFDCLGHFIQVRVELTRPAHAYALDLMGFGLQN